MQQPIEYPPKSIEVVPEKKRCSAITKAGLPCKGIAMRGSDLCKSHYGTTLSSSGIIPPKRRSGTYRTQYDRKKGYKRWLPLNIASRYEEILNDEEVIGLHNEIVLLKLRLTELLEQLDSGENPRTWKELNSKWSVFMQAVRDGNTDKQTKMLYELDDLITHSIDKFMVWEEISRLTENVRKLVQTELDIETKRESLMSIERVLALIAMLFSEWTKAIYAHASPDSAKRIIVEVDAASRKLISTDPGS